MSTARATAPCRAITASMRGAIAGRFEAGDVDVEDRVAEAFGMNVRRE
jgi:hypothetical protein